VAIRGLLPGGRETDRGSGLSKDNW
jgi:hypothetical protein